MDFVAGSTALIAAQYATALAMTGLYLADRSQSCARDWALGQLLIGTGVLILVLNAGVLREPVLIAGSNCLVIGAILQWQGIRSFYGHPKTTLCWGLGLGFFMVHALLLIVGEPAPRGILLSVTLMIVLTLSAVVILKASASRPTFGSSLALVAVGFLAVNNLVRIIGLVIGAVEPRPVSSEPLMVMTLYLVPLVGTLLYSAGLMLMHFERTVREQRHLANHDELTGLLNRRAIVAAGVREMEVALRNQHSIAIALVDIDSFKQVNDLLGHEAGDKVLVEIARLLENSCRSVDLVGRYGGEEFCMVFPGVSTDGCDALGKRLMEQVRQYVFTDGRQITLSAGFAAIEPGDAACSWTKLINRADSELYRAKNQGRNRVSIASADNAAR